LSGLFEDELDPQQSGEARRITTNMATYRSNLRRALGPRYATAMPASTSFEANRPGTRPASVSSL
jgi:hypothetical protein